MKCVVFSSKPYDEEFFAAEARDNGGSGVDWELIFRPFRLEAATAGAAAGFDAVCVFVNDVLDGDCLRRLKDGGVKWIVLRCAGFNGVDLEEAKRLGMVVTRVPAYSPHAVAEHTVALLMTLNRQIHRAFNRVRDHNFSLAGLVGTDLYRKTVGLIGLGKIGRTAAKIFRGYGCEVLGFDPQADQAWAAENGVTLCRMDELIERADIVSLHLPLTKETHHLLNAESFGRMKPSAFLVNTSRGKLIDTKALIGALKGGRLGGVALDVYEEEEGVFFEDLSGQVLQDDDLSRLLTFPNVLITAHQAFLTKEALSEIARITLGNLRALGAGGEALPETRLA